MIVLPAAILCLLLQVPLEGPFDPGSDTGPPGVVSDLFVTSTTASSATLQWMAPGDDEYAGTATTYDLRYSTEGPITTAARMGEGGSQ